MEELSRQSDPAAAPLPASPPLARPGAGVTLRQLFFCFVKVGLTAFGGRTQAWIFRAVFEERRWLAETDFLAGVTIARILPGANPVNLSLYVGQRLRGWPGAAIATLGMAAPAIVIVLLSGALYARLAHFPLTHFLLIGIGIGICTVGATLAAGLKVARKIERRAAIIVIGLATFIAVGVLHWSMAPVVPVVAVLAPLSVALALRRTHG